METLRDNLKLHKPKYNNNKNVSVQYGEFGLKCIDNNFEEFEIFSTGFIKNLSTEN